jgi:hypothetical protein
MAKHRWLFSVVDDDREAADECERRADLYEELTGGLVLKVKYHSTGIVGTTQ